MREALLRTADWLEAHPDQHIVAFRTRHVNGDRDPDYRDDPETDVCYCAAGRLAYEMGLGYVDGDNRRFIPRHPTLYTQINQVNDFGASRRPYVKGNQRQGNPAVIQLLRELANN